MQHVLYELFLGSLTFKGCWSSSSLRKWAQNDYQGKNCFCLVSCFLTWHCYCSKHKPILYQHLSYNTVNVTETCQFLNRRTAVVRLNRSLENVIRTLTPYMKNARSTVRQRRCVLRKRTYRFNYYCARRRYGCYVSNCFSARV